MTRLAPIVALLLLAFAWAQEADYHQVPDRNLRFEGEAVTIVGTQGHDTFVPGLGWLSGSAAPAPIRSGGAVYLGSTNLERLGLPSGGEPQEPPQSDWEWLPEREASRAGAPVPGQVDPLSPGGQPGGTTTAVRYGGDVEIRVVVDLPELGSTDPLARLEHQGMLDHGEPLVLDLPRVTLPPSQPDPYHGVDVSLLETPSGVRLELYAPKSSYQVFSLQAPTRLVIDLVPLMDRHVRTRRSELMQGVSYHEFGAQTPAGESPVHLLEIESGAGEFRVVGTSEVPRTLTELADGAFAAINAGYFNTSTFQAIGLLRVDYGLQSLPSRNRASVGFGFAGPVMTRVQATVNVRVDGRLHVREAPVNGNGVEVYASAGSLAGSPRRGALVVQHGLVIANRVGPVTVPENGYVIVYPPEDRDLALIDPGARAGIEVDFEPDDFQAVRYAVEAGPLLVQGGEPAFEPEREAFPAGQRILDAYTQQAAIGLRPDGTVLLLVAEAMRAQDLIPLFLSLGAEHAMRLDSGSSATLYADGEVLNRARERRIVSAIVFVPEG